MMASSGADPRLRVLRAGVQARHGEQRCRPERRRLVRHQPDHPRSLREDVRRLQEDVDRVFQGGVHYHWAAGVCKARRAIGDDDLVKEMSLGFFFGDHI